MEGIHDPMNGKIYTITNSINGKRYFGQTIGEKPDIRWNHHRHHAQRGKRISSRLYNSMRKHGVENFKFEVIIDKIYTQDELNRLEKVWIEACRTMDPDHGYNLKEGGANGSLSEETKKKIAVRLTGNKNSAGAIRSEEYLINLSERSKGLKRTLEFVENCRLRQLGSIRSEESSRKKSEFMRDNPNSGQIKKGAKFSEETKQKMRLAQIARQAKKREAICGEGN